MLNLAATLEYSANIYPENIAIYFAEKNISYKELNAMANKVAIGIQNSGIKKGDRVALCCPNIPQFIYSYYGILKAGCVVLPFNVLLKSDEISFILDNSEAKGIICFEGTKELKILEQI